MTLGDTTEFGSPRTLGVVGRENGWLGVVAPELGNGTVGWLEEDAGSITVVGLDVELEIDLSRRELVLRRDGEVVLRISVAVGADDSPTPIGRFSITDLLPGDRYGPYYGCCILALSARQPSLPSGWQGGDRVAIHGTDDPSSIGRASSAGCLRASDRDLREVVAAAELGAPVRIHP